LLSARRRRAAWTGKAITASYHVSNILGKLGVAGRVEAAAEAVRLGITTRPT
jgi:hypothetical protein